jgi:hypothetical protein
MRVPVLRAVTALSATAVLVLDVFVPSAQAARPTALYVSQGGHNSGTCPSAHPCATVSYALTKAASGATIRVSGAINDHLQISAPVTITNWRGGPAHAAGLLNGTKTPNQAVITVNVGVTGVTVHDLTIRNGVLGIYNDGTMKLTGSTVSGNHTAGEPYAGIWNYYNGTITVVDSTVTSNSGDGSIGAGLYNIGTATVIASTISKNSGGGVYSGQNDTATFGASIVSGNSKGVNCSGYDAGSFISAGYNLTSDRTGGACKFTAATDRVNKTPRLGSLARNGGPTRTLLPAAGGPADDVIPKTTTLRGVKVCPGVDQRGVARPAKNDRRCTIGAVEV